jgi:hypothetical protein
VIIDLSQLEASPDCGTARLGVAINRCPLTGILYAPPHGNVMAISWHLSTCTDSDTDPNNVHAGRRPSYQLSALLQTVLRIL